MVTNTDTDTDTDTNTDTDSDLDADKGTDTDTPKPKPKPQPKFGLKLRLRPEARVVIELAIGSRWCSYLGYDWSQGGIGLGLGASFDKWQRSVGPVQSYCYAWHFRVRVTLSVRSEC